MASIPTSPATDSAKEHAREIAREIRRQLGPQCLAMLGAHTLLAHTNPANDPALSLKIQGSPKVNYLKIALTPRDLYRVEFGWIGGPLDERAYQVVHVAELVYAEDLHELIEQQTGLYTRI